MLNKQTISFAFNNLKNETTLLFQPLYISCLFFAFKTRYILSVFIGFIRPKEICKPNIFVHQIP